MSCSGENRNAATPSTTVVARTAAPRMIAGLSRWWRRRLLRISAVYAEIASTSQPRRVPRYVEPEDVLRPHLAEDIIGKPGAGSSGTRPYDDGAV
jgi:hypothetical protein